VQLVFILFTETYTTTFNWTEEVSFLVVNEADVFSEAFGVHEFRADFTFYFSPFVGGAGAADSFFVVELDKMAPQEVSFPKSPEASGLWTFVVCLLVVDVADVLQ
jgi:hypothetical protein